MNRDTQALAGSVTAPIAAYNLTVSPVTLIASTTPIVLGPTMNSLSANYPVGTVLTGFNTATQKSLTARQPPLAHPVSPQLASTESTPWVPNIQTLTPHPET